MAPKKRGLPFSSSSKKSNSSNPKTSQPSKFGIQHFFERHSQSQAAASASPTPSHIEDAERQEVTPPPHRSSERSNNVKNDGNMVSPNSQENTKAAPVKRVKFSPGMIIKQSQDDGGDEVTWKISPMNERLKSFSWKIIQRTNGSFGNPTKSSVLGACQNIREEKNCQDPVVGPEKLLSSSDPLVPKASTVSAILESVRGGGYGVEAEILTSSIVDGQCPFQTPPSTINVLREPGCTISCNGAPGLLDSKEYRKDLLELLDQVEDAITTEEPISRNLESCSNVDRNAYKEIHTTQTKSFTRDKSTETFHHASQTSKSCSMGSRKAAAENIITAKSLPEGLSEVIIQDCSVNKFLLLEVYEKSDGTSSLHQQKPFKVLRLLNEESNQERTLHLYDEWFYSVTRPGDTVNVIGEFDSNGTCVIDKSNNLFILHPDIVLSGTRVASSFNCLRRAVLDERLKSSEQSIPALRGTLLHQIFQAGLLKDFPTKEFLEEFASNVLQKNVENLYACGASENEMYASLVEMIPRLLKWIIQYKQQILKKPCVSFGRLEGEKLVSIAEVLDIEEMAWAPRYGLKGIIDVSVLVKVGSSKDALIDTFMPLEFKTGKGTSGQSAMEHQAQVILYTLLMSERYLKPDIDSGLLYYLHNDQTIGIKAQRCDLVGLIMRRNELAADLLKASTTQTLPPMLQNPAICRSCRHLNICTVYHKAHGGGAESSGLGDSFDSFVDHLTSNHYEFLLKWDHLIDLEAKTSLVARKELLCPNGFQRERNTNIISLFILDNTNGVPANQNGRFSYQFVYKDFHDDASLVDVHEVNRPLGCTLRCGDYVILSTESGRVAVARGIISDISDHYVTVSLSKKLRLPGINSSSEKSNLTREIWRIDKDELSSSYAVMRFNLTQLFLQHSENAQLRKLIVDLQAPRFDSGCANSQDPAVSYVRSEKSLNEDQQKAIHKMLNARDYALILGMPGTGKTSTMVHAVKAFLIRGASILLTSYTNSAVDNLLLKLKVQKIDFIRIGRHEAMHDDIREHCISATNICNVEEIKQRMNNARVVGVTCLGIHHSLLTNKRFDICIMDEAGQTTLPVSLGPLMFASVFVLVGDHYQLPPLVQSTEARETGLGESLFCKLSEAYPHAISALQCQYRMCAGIMELSNGLIYGNRLRCGSAEIANARLNILFLNPISPWIREILDPNRPVIFINTDSLPAFESRQHKNVNNPIEASIVSKVIKELLDRGVSAGEIGVITPYNSQADLIRSSSDSDVDVHTIDRYQGRDKDCIILSFVRSCEVPRNMSSSLLGDWRRINVALTRPKKKLIMVGSCRTLSKVPLLKLLIEIVNKNGHIFNITEKDLRPLSELKKCSSTKS